MFFVFLFVWKTTIPYIFGTSEKSVISTPQQATQGSKGIPTIRCIWDGLLRGPHRKRFSQHFPHDLVAKFAAGLGSKGCHFLDLVAFDQKKSLTFEAHALAILQDGAKGRSARRSWYIYRPTFTIFLPRKKRPFGKYTNHTWMLKGILHNL